MYYRYQRYTIWSSAKAYEQGVNQDVHVCFIDYSKAFDKVE